MKRKLASVLLALLTAASAALAYGPDDPGDPGRGRETGPGLTFWARGMSFVSEDLNDYLEDHDFERVEGVGAAGTTLVWSFTPHFCLGLEFGGGGTGYLGSHSRIGGDEVYREVQATLGYTNLIAQFRGTMGGGRWGYRVGGGVGVASLNLELETTPEGEATTVERYRSVGVDAMVEGQVQYNVSPMLGVFASAGGYGVNLEPFERGGDEVDDPPEADGGGGFFGFGLAVHL